MIKEYFETPAISEYDVVVCGGGFAGISASLAAARAGARVLLIERKFILGGLGTAGLVTIYLPLCDGVGNQVSFGIAEELFRLSIKHGAEALYPDAWLEGEELSEMTELSHSFILKDILKHKENDGTYMPVTIPTIPQIRMTRRIVGAYTMDDSEMHKSFPDSVGMFSDWRRRGPVYELPFRSLYGNSVKNLITAGRCISVTDAMWDITRVIPVCAVSGEAAGTAAALSSDFSELDINKLQAVLTESGVIIHK